MKITFKHNLVSILLYLGKQCRWLTTLTGSQNGCRAWGEVIKILIIVVAVSSSRSQNGRKRTSWTSTKNKIMFTWMMGTLLSFSNIFTYWYIYIRIWYQIPQKTKVPSTRWSWNVSVSWWSAFSVCFASSQITIHRASSSAILHPFSRLRGGQ